MKHATNTTFTALNQKEIAFLTKEVKETLATQMVKNPAQYQSFGAIDLWNSRRTMRTMASRRRFF